MVLAGAGVDHEELVRLGQKYFGDIRLGAEGDDHKGQESGAAESRYSGGESRIVVGADKVTGESGAGGKLPSWRMCVYRR